MTTATPAKDAAEKLVEATQAVSKSLKADVILFNQPIDDEVAVRFHEILESTSRRHESVFLILVTFGGDAHAAYVVARDLQLRYRQRIVLCVAGDCYSAGTLLVCGAHNLVIGNRGRLGPLDVQLVKRDELFERSSGLTTMAALDELQRKSYQTFLQHATDLKREFGPHLSFPTALQTASNLTVGTFSQIYSQIDPIRLAEDARALRIASHYATVLDKASRNLKPGAVEQLLEGYPSHECIIDRLEAAELFRNVREPNTEELELLALLGPAATRAVPTASAEHLIVLSEMKRKGETLESQEHDEKAIEKQPHGVNGGNGPADSASVAGAGRTAGKAKPREGAAETTAA